MKKTVLSLLASTSILFAIEIDQLESFQANFTQNIIDDHNKTITYKGELYANKPSSALWKYLSPVQKSVYLKDFMITIVEPELEQVIIKHISRDIDLFNIISTAKKIDDKNYIAQYSSQQYAIKLENDVLKSISYKDSFDNEVTISFSDQKENEKIDEKVFHINIPKEYDLIRE